MLLWQKNPFGYIKVASKWENFSPLALSELNYKKSYAEL